MPHVRRDILIARPAEAVFDFVAEPRNEPGYNRQLLRIDALDEGCVGVGTRWSALVRSGRWPTNVVIECTEYQRPLVLGSTITTPDGEFVRRLTFEPVPEGTRITWDWQIRTRRANRLRSFLSFLRMARQERRLGTALKVQLEFSADVPQPASDVSPAR
jgi:hypothetical protein